MKPNGTTLQANQQKQECFDKANLSEGRSDFKLIGTSVFTNITTWGTSLGVKVDLNMLF